MARFSTALPSGDPILPFKRIVAYYGNLYSKRWGYWENIHLRRYGKDCMPRWRSGKSRSPSTPVQPAIHYIAVVAQGVLRKTAPTANVCPKVRLIPPLSIAAMGKPLYFWTYRWLWYGTGRGASTGKVSSMPHAPSYRSEFSMKDGSRPGTKIGSFDAGD